MVGYLGRSRPYNLKNRTARTWDLGLTHRARLSLRGVGDPRPKQSTGKAPKYTRGPSKLYQGDAAWLLKVNRVVDC